MTSLLVILLAVLVVLLVALIFLLYRTSGPPISSAKDQKDQTSSSTSSSLSPELRYDVFLSFKGKDTGKNFVYHLYHALMRKGFCVFMEEELRIGDIIIPLDPLKVIEESKFAIVILSRDYASSTIRLDELVKIIECKEYRKQIVLPVFYQVEIHEVRNQTGHFLNVFAEHENLFQTDRVLKWRQALTVLTNICGFDSRDSRMDSQVIQEIVRRISKELKYDFLTRKIELVGADSRVKEVKSYLDLKSNDSRIVGIWGMAGIGKTAIAKQVFADIRDQFEACSFVPNIREHLANYTVVHLQKILIRSLFDSDADIETYYEGISLLRHRLRFKKVLIVLDDVASIEQFESLFGKSNELGYFGPKSRIIITTRDKHVLSIHAVRNIYQVEKLNDVESFQLLCLKAFGENHPPDNSMELCKKVVAYAEGLPLALEVLGSFLYGRPIEVWVDALSVLGKELSKEIFVPLRISYDGLTSLEKNIFLDIACFFVGEDYNRVRKILDACGFQPIFGIRVLVEKSLITVEKNALLMHDLIRQMGLEIVRQESLREPYKRTRLWHHEDIYDTLEEKKGTKAVEGIILRKPENKKIDLNADAFSKMSNLRLLKIYNADISGPPSLPHNLRLLEWHGYRLNELTIPNKLVELRLCNSRIEVLLAATLALERLVVLDLSNGNCITKTPDFKMFPYLETLIFEGCSSLSEVDPSIMHLQNLSELNLKDCKNLLSLPNEIWSMTSLRILNLSGCLNLLPIPKHNLEHLEIILSSSTKVAEDDDFRNSDGEQCKKHTPQTSKECIGQDLQITKVSKNMGSFYQWDGEEEKMNLATCSRNQLFSMRLVTYTSQGKLPRTAFTMKSLLYPDVSGCYSLNKLMLLRKITELNLSGRPIVTVPESIEVLSVLKSFKLMDCKRLETLPGNIYKLKCLEGLYLNRCTKLKTFPEIYEPMERLRKLVLSESAIQELPSHFEYLIGLTKLSLNGCKNLKSLPINIRHLGNLHELSLKNCESLKSLPERMSSPLKLFANNCTSLEIVPCSTIALISNKGKQGGYFAEYFQFLNCPKLDQNAYHNIMAETLLRIYRAAASKSIPHVDDKTYSGYTALHVGYPGNKFPEWIEGEMEGNSLCIDKLPPGRSFSKVLGLIVCANVAVKHHRCHKEHRAMLDSEQKFGARNGWYITLQDSLSFHSNLDHVFISSTPSIRWLPSYDVSQIQVIFNLHGEFEVGDENKVSEHFEVRKCGFKCIYGEELEEFKANNQNEGD